MKNEVFSITASVDGEQVSFTISSGSPPTGLPLNPNNRLFSKIRIQIASSQSVSNMGSNQVRNRFITLSLCFKSFLHYSIILKHSSKYIAKCIQVVE